MFYSRVALVTAAMLIAGCASDPAEGSCTNVFPSPSVWHFPTRQHHVSSIIFNSDGTVTFDRAFRNYKNPGWSYDAEAGMLSLTLPNATDEDISAIATKQLPKGYVDGVDVAAKTILWKMNSCTDHFYFQVQRHEFAGQP